jgi:hypothetical protein
MIDETLGPTGIGRIGGAHAHSGQTLNRRLNVPRAGRWDGLPAAVRRA